MSKEMNELDPGAHFQGEFIEGSIKGTMASVGAAKGDLWKVPIDAIHVYPGLNPRDNTAVYRAKVREIADSIIRDGYDVSSVLDGVCVQEQVDDDVIQKVYVIDGHTRRDAVLLALSEGAQLDRTKDGHVWLPMTVRHGYNMEQIICRMKRRNESNPFTPLETARLVQRLSNNGWPESRISVEMCISEQYVKNLLRLIAAPVAIRNYVRDGKIAASLAINLLTKFGPKAEAMIREKVEAASKSGGARVTAKAVAENPRFQRAIKRSAKPLAEACLKAVRDPGFAQLSQDIREVIQSLAQQLEEAQKPQEPKKAKVKTST